MKTVYRLWINLINKQKQGVWACDFFLKASVLFIVFARLTLVLKYLKYYICVLTNRMFLLSLKICRVWNIFISLLQSVNISKSQFQHYKFIATEQWHSKDYMFTSAPLFVFMSEYGSFILKLTSAPDSAKKELLTRQVAKMWNTSYYLFRVYFIQIFLTRLNFYSAGLRIPLPFQRMK